MSVSSPSDGGVMSLTKQYVEVNGIDMQYQIHGDGKPLVLLHGFLGSGDTWATILGDLDRLCRDYRLLIPDLRGHGGSTNPAGEFTMRQSALDVFALLDHLGIERFRAIGMSGGSMTLLHMATQQPDRVERLVLISATTHFPAQARTIMAGMTEPRPDEEWAMMRRLHTHGDDQIRGLWRMGRALADNDSDMSFTAPSLARITASTLVVHGDRDPFFPISIAMEMYEAIPAAWLWVVPNGGHLNIVAENLTEEFLATASAFLRGDWEQP